MQNVDEFIKTHWSKTIHKPGNKVRATIDLPFTYSVPCFDGGFEDFFYWDTYFTNLGLAKDGYLDVVKSNIDTMAYLINKFGYMPNASYLLNRTQPPLFVRSVFDYYIATNDLEVIKRYKKEMIQELNYFYDHRTIKEFGLASYCPVVTDDLVDDIYAEYLSRINVPQKNKKQAAKNMLAQCESGWDCNARFENFETTKYLHLDLNCILYDAEKKLSQMLDLIKNKESIKYLKLAEDRKAAINKYLYSEKDHAYLDYNYVDKKFSLLTSVASLYPYTFAISSESKDAINVLKKLEFEFGLSTAEKKNNQGIYQWDYPYMWPPLVYFAYVAFMNLHEVRIAQRLSLKYISTVDKVFVETGALWEKYNVLDGGVAISKEYKTPKMLGWTAGVYRYLKEDMKKSS